MDAEVAHANRKPFWSRAGEAPPSEPKPTSQAGLMGTEDVLNPHNNDRAARYTDRTPEKTQFHRGHTTAEANGPRLAISPSVKSNTSGLPAGYRTAPKIVRSRGASRSVFDEGRAY